MSAHAFEISKALSTLRARAALQHLALLELADGTFLLARADWCRPMATLHDVARLLDTMEGIR